MMEFIYSLNIVITVPLILIMLYSIGEMKLKTKQRNIYIIIFIGIIIANFFIIRDHREVKSIHNYSTYHTYQNMLYIFKDIDRFEIADVSDIKDFNHILERLGNQSALLAYQLDYAVLTGEEDEALKTNLFSLSEELSNFIFHHNRLYANSIDILDDTIPLYNKLKSSISEFGNQIRNRGGNHGSNIIGVIEHRIKPIEKDLSKLNSIMDSISEISTSIMED